MQVQIKATQVVHYDQVVEMSEEDFNILKDLDDTEYSMGDKEYAVLDRYIDYSSVYDSEMELTDVDVRIHKNKAAKH